MKSLRAYIILLLSCTILATANAADISSQADSAYNETAYNNALQLYKAAIDSAGVSTHLYYNIGNTYYRLNDLGRAVLWYERALQLDPTNDDARLNLAFVNTRIADKPVDERSLIARGYDRLTNGLHPDTWAMITFLLFLLTVIAIVGYIISNRVIVRKTCFFGGGIMLVLTLFSLSVTLTAASRATNHDYAIIVVPSSQLSTAPRESTDANTQAFLLHEGTKIEVVDSVIPQDINAERWYEVKVNGKARAWIKGSDIERI